MTGTPQRRPLTPADERMWATLLHVGGAVLFFLPSLIGYIVFKERSVFLAEHTRTALNFQLTMAILEVVGWVLTIIFIGGLLTVFVYVFRIVMSIVAAVRANRGELYKYPLSFDLIK